MATSLVLHTQRLCTMDEQFPIDGVECGILARESILTVFSKYEI